MIYNNTHEKWDMRYSVKEKNYEITKYSCKYYYESIYNKHIILRLYVS